MEPREKTLCRIIGMLEALAERYAEETTLPWRKHWIETTLEQTKNEWNTAYHTAQTTVEL